MAFEKKRKELITLWGNDNDAAMTVDSKIRAMEAICGSDDKMKIIDCLAESDLILDQALCLFFS